MTWVVGATTMFGYGVVVSDICVTVTRGLKKERIDVLRKSYPVGRFIVAGFSGSVRIGFSLLADLQASLKMTEKEERENECWQPAFVAENWAPRAREIFARAPEAAKRQSASILMVGIHPRENAMAGGVPVVSILRAPDFTPVTEEGFGKVMGIGSGAKQEAMEILRKTVANVDMLQAEVNNPGGFGRYIASGMTTDLFHAAPPGVSRHLHVTLVGINSLSFGPNNITYYPHNGPPEELRMPEVAESYAEMYRMLNLKADAADEVSASACHALAAVRRGRLAASKNASGKALGDGTLP